jgi:N-acetylneuraminic acid mutarotase
VARSGSAATSFGDGAILIAGLTSGLVSTTTVFKIAPTAHVRQLPSLPSGVHDAAAVTLAGRVLLFGGGVSEGSNHILKVTPGAPTQIGTLPQPLSDLVAAPIAGMAYVTGGWNGSDTNRNIYAVSRGGHLITVGRLPLGVRYPAAGALDGRLIVAGGEMASGDPTSRAWSFDPATRRVARLPDLPTPLDHTAGAVLDGTFYAIGGLRRGQLTNAILAWRPGLRRWRLAGRLPRAVQNLIAVGYGGGILALGGRTAGAATSEGTVLKPG